MGCWAPRKPCACLGTAADAELGCDERNRNASPNDREENRPWRDFRLKEQLLGWRFRNGEYGGFAIVSEGGLPALDLLQRPSGIGFTDLKPHDTLRCRIEN